MANKTKKDLELENKYLRKSQFASNATLIIRDIIRYGALVLVGYFAYLSIDSLAGKTTLANLAMNVIGDLKIGEWFAYLFGASGIGYGLLQRRDRKATVSRLQGHTKEVEQVLDAKRSSSLLTATGDTNPIDRI